MSDPVFKLLEAVSWLLREPQACLLPDQLTHSIREAARAVHAARAPVFENQGGMTHFRFQRGYLEVGGGDVVVTEDHWAKIETQLDIHCDEFPRLVTRLGMWFDDPRPSKPGDTRVWLHRVVELSMFDEQKCSSCGGRGGYGRDGLGWWEVFPCEVCGETAPQNLADEKNEKIRSWHRGVQHERIKFGIRERAWAEAWAEFNRGQPGINGGWSGLQLLLSPTLSTMNPFSPSCCRTRDVPPMERVTDRDYLVAATVIQFLGTNGGAALMDRYKKRLAELEQEQAAKNAKEKP